MVSRIIIAIVIIYVFIVGMAAAATGALYLMNNKSSEDDKYSRRFIMIAAVVAIALTIFGLVSVSKIKTKTIKEYAFVVTSDIDAEEVKQSGKLGLSALSDKGKKKKFSLSKSKLKVVNKDLTKAYLKESVIEEKVFWLKNGVKYKKYTLYLPKKEATSAE